MIMNIEDRRTFTADINGKDIELYIRSPNMQDKREAKRVYNTILSDALNAGAPLRARLPEILKKQNIWNDEKDAEYESLMDELGKCDEKLYKGGIKLNEAKEIAIRMREIRGELRMLLLPQASLVSITAEAQAEDQEMNYLVSKCTVYNSNRNKPFFSGYEDYLERSSEAVAVVAATRFAEIYKGLWDDEETLPEIQFLKKYNFVNKDLRLVNEDGHLVDSEGNLVNELGQKVELDDEGNDVLVDDIGQPINLNINPMPFLDEEGKPITEEGEVAEESEQKVE